MARSTPKLLTIQYLTIGDEVKKLILQLKRKSGQYGWKSIWTIYGRNAQFN